MAEYGRYRPASVTDLPALVAIEQAAGYSHWSEAQLADSLAVHHVLVAEVSGNVAAYAVFSHVLDEAELLNIVVAPAFQGQGLGRGLLRHGLGLLFQCGIEKCFLEVGAGNAVAISLYEASGFCRIALRRAYYRRPVTDTNSTGTEDAIIMQLLLKEITCKN